MSDRTDNAPSMAERITRARKGDRQAEEQLVLDNLPLVYAIMRRFTSRGIETDDLKQLGMLGLLKAIRRFDTAYDVCFSTFAVPYIAGEIKQFLRDDGIIRYSRQVKALATRIAAFMREHDDCRLDVLVTELGCSAEEIAIAVSSMGGTVSLDTVSAEGGATLGERQPAPDEHEDVLNRLHVAELTQGLTKREMLILHLRYRCDLTQKETAARLHLSQVQISRLEKKIINQIRCRGTRVQCSSDCLARK